jgi:hypothetical protein
MEKWPTHAHRSIAEGVTKKKELKMRAASP